MAKLNRNQGAFPYAPLALTNFFFYNWYLTLEGSICPYGDSSLLSRAYNTVCTQCETFCGVCINVKWHIPTLQNYTEQVEGSENVLVWAFGLLISTGGRHCCPTHRMCHGGQKMSSLSFWRPEQMELAMALVLPFEDWRPWSLQGQELELSCEIPGNHITSLWSCGPGPWQRRLLEPGLHVNGFIALTWQINVWVTKNV